MMRRKLLAVFVGLACAVATTGCIGSFFSNDILNFIGPTTAVAAPSSSGVANPGQDYLLNGGESFLLFGSGQTLNGSQAGFTYQWTVTSTPPNAVQPVLTNANTSQLTFRGLTAGSYVVELTVTDGTHTGVQGITIVVQ